MQWRPKLVDKSVPGRKTLGVLWGFGGGGNWVREQMVGILFGGFCYGLVGFGLWFGS
jgi:hypothetical protein